MATYTGTPRTWVAGETVTAALMNSDVRDPLAALAGAWTSYTPTLSQGASTNIAKSVTYAKYIRVGKLVIGSVAVTATGTGTAGSAITLTMPVTAAAAGLYVGSGAYQDVGTAYYSVVATLTSTTTVTVVRADAPWAASVGIDPNIAVAAGDVLAFHFTYEAA